MRTIFALLAVLVVAVGCVRESDENANEGTNPSPGEIAVEVLITDEAIQMPDEISAGAVLFEVTNNGTVPHGFAIDGVEERLDELAVDELATLRAELEPGTYTVFSPAEADADTGLEHTLTVTEAEASPTANPGQEGVGPSEGQAPVDEDEGS